MKAIRIYFPFLFFLAGAVSMLIMSMHYMEHDATGIMKNKAIAAEA